MIKEHYITNKSKLFNPHEEITIVDIPNQLIFSNILDNLNLNLKLYNLKDKWKCKNPTI